MSKELTTSKGKTIKNYVAYLTDRCNKKGELRGENKDETKRLRAMCVHHKITKKGKVKPVVINDGNGTCYCPMCKHKFSTHLLNNEELEKTVGKFTACLDQTRFMIEAADLGKDVAKYVAGLSVEVMKFPKAYKRCRKVVEKSDHVKNKKKKKDRYGSSNTSYTGWR